ncbi:MAG TPA: hypothetical protein VKI65_07175, partial [Gemmataceae bacterium]|nr:hypothetical protein [Gemmataceae bacterium]
KAGSLSLEEQAAGALRPKNHRLLKDRLLRIEPVMIAESEEDVAPKGVKIRQRGNGGIHTRVEAPARGS